MKINKKSVIKNIDGTPLMELPNTFTHKHHNANSQTPAHKRGMSHGNQHCALEL